MTFKNNLKNKIILYILNNKDKIKINSASVERGDIFVCLKGEKTHGNNYIKEAIEKAKLLISDFPNYAPGFVNYGGLLKEKGELIQAKEITKKAIDIDEKSEIAHLNLGAIYKELGDLTRAIISTRKALEINPSIENGLSNLAAMLIDNEQIKAIKRPN